MIIDESNINEFILTGKVLDVSNKGVTKIVSIPSNIKTIYCDNNKLTELPELPVGLNMLRCNNNNLTSLPELPESLRYLNCSENKLTELPIIPNLFYLSVDINPLKYDININNIKEYNKIIKRKSILKCLLNEI